jgi:hypothetical protein
MNTLWRLFFLLLAQKKAVPGDLRHRILKELKSKESLMKLAVLAFLSAALLGCSNDQKIAELQMKVDSLQVLLSKAYKPGFGEFMSGVQVHHAKLWFAGTSQNWPLAEFELHEIDETIDELQTQQSRRRETQTLVMIKPPLDAVKRSIAHKNLHQFKDAFAKLTQACNDCHRAVDFSFNVVTIATTPPFSNQSFEPRHE